MDYAWIITSLKAQAWEEAKGKLRAIAAISGQNPTGKETTMHRYKRIEEAVENFIFDFENDGFHE